MILYNITLTQHFNSLEKKHDNCLKSRYFSAISEL